MESNNEVLAKIAKLLRLSQSTNEHEAALAAAKAQELMDRHQISKAMLDADATSADADESIEHFTGGDDALDSFTARHATWKGRLAATICSHNACACYYSGTSLVLVGRPTDAATVRYLYAYCVREIERFTEMQGPGHGRTWYNNYRLGCVTGIASTLGEQRRKLHKELRTEAATSGGNAIVKVNNAITKFEDRTRETNAWLKKHLKLKPRHSHSAHDSDAYERGVKDGGTINLGANKALGRGANKQLGK
jgi:hypothetical protein